MLLRCVDTNAEDDDGDDDKDENDGDIDRISYAFEEAGENKKPVAVLVGDEYSSWN